MQTILGTPEEEQVRQIVRAEIARFYEEQTVELEPVEMDIQIYEDESGAQASSPLYLKLMDDAIRKVMREEIASLAGKALRRLQDENFTRSFERNAATDAAKDVIGHFWGEILAEYGDPN